MKITLVFLLFSASFLAFGWGKGVDVVEDLRKYSTCKSKPIVLPPEFALGGLAAAPNCLDIEEETCIKMCILFHYDGGKLHTGDGLNKKHMRTLIQNVKVDADIEKEKEKVIEAFEACSDENPIVPKPKKGAACPEATKLLACVRTKFAEICGK